MLYKTGRLLTSNMDLTILFIKGSKYQTCFKISKQTIICCAVEVGAYIKLRAKSSKNGNSNKDYLHYSGNEVLPISFDTMKQGNSNVKF